MWIQKEIKIAEKPRGFHLITKDILSAIPELANIKVGLMNIFIRHTSASLTVNENVSSDVRRDFERHFNKIVPDGADYFEHNYEGDDDMAAHIKSSMIGQSLNIPVSNGKLNLGTWQGIYLCEHRNYSGKRSLVITLWGETDEQA